MRSPRRACGWIASTPRIRVARRRAAASSPDAIRTAWARSRRAGRCGRRRSRSRHLLGKAGYRCGHFGKWHVGAVKAGSPTNPGAMGFHEWVSHDNFFELNPSLSRNGGPPEVFQGESSEIVVDEAIRFIDRRQESGQAVLHDRLVRLAARAVQRPARRSRALRRPAREVLEEGQPHVQRNRRPDHAAAGRSPARALRRDHRHGSRDRPVAKAPRRAGTATGHAALLLRRQRHVRRRRARRRRIAASKDRSMKEACSSPASSNGPRGFRSRAAAASAPAPAICCRRCAPWSASRCPNRPLDGIDLTAAARWQDDRAPQPALLLGVTTPDASRAIQAANRGSIPNCKRGRRRW